MAVENSSEEKGNAVISYLIVEESMQKNFHNDRST